METKKEQPKRCTMCNKIFDEWDLQENVSYQKWIGYGSVHDTEYLDLQLCCKCFDKVLAFILKNSINNPLTDYAFENTQDGTIRRHLLKDKICRKKDCIKKR